MPVSFPSAVAPNAMVCKVAGRYPTSVNICSRVIINFTGRFKAFAAATTNISCGHVRKAIPKPPPTNSAETCIFFSSILNALAMVLWVDFTPCVLVYTITLSSLLQLTAMPCNSIGLCTSAGMI